MSDYYELLQVPRNADEETIKKSYWRLARQYHPDSNKARIAAEHMKLLNAAYDVLSDPAKRRDYDERLAATTRRTATASAPAKPAAAQPAPPAARRRSSTPAWMIWLSVTALLVLATLSATLFVMRDSVLSLLPQAPASATRIAGAAPLLTAQPTATTAPLATATLTPVPLTSTATATSTREPPTPSLTRAPSVAPTSGAYPAPATVVITGTKFVYAEPTNGNGPSDIFVSNATGSSRFNVTNTFDRAEVAPSWSPLGQRIVFGEFSSGNLFVSAGDGTQLSPLVTDASLYSSNPVWAPVGSLIAFVGTARSEYEKGNTKAAKVFVVDFSSKIQRLLADQPGQDLSWSPDVKWLAFRVPSGNGATVYIVAVDKPSAPPFFFFVPRVRRMAWTTDSKQLVYEAFARDTNRDGTVDEHDQPDLSVITLQPLAVNPLNTRLTVVSPRGRFPGSPVNGEFYPPIISSVQGP